MTDPQVLPPRPTPTRPRWWKSPLFLLLLLTPGIPEYLTGSSSATAIALNPAGFALQLALNAALYTAGALLIREAVVRWKKGWASVLLLGAAYGIAEEGLAVHTFFEAGGSPVGILGAYGRLFGVNWVWVSGLTVFHAVYSIALPLLILGLVYPETKGRPLVGTRGLRLAAIAFVADVVLLSILVGSHPDAAQTLFFLAVVGVLVALAYRAPAGLLAPRPGASKTSPTRLAILGGSWFPLWIVAGSILPFTRLPPVLDAAVLAAGELAILGLVGRGIGRDDAEWSALAFATGLIAILVPWEVLLVVASDPLALVLGILSVVGLVLLRPSVRARSHPPQIPFGVFPPESPVGAEPGRSGWNAASRVPARGGNGREMRRGDV
ncbi:MAG: hypothetical protein L3K16_08400 [Thermoplasmata archaeon]|nr:hypothetical protein [Thermoplasmata archaeon]